MRTKNSFVVQAWLMVFISKTLPFPCPQRPSSSLVMLPWNTITGGGEPPKCSAVDFEFMVRNITYLHTPRCRFRSGLRLPKWGDMSEWLFHVENQKFGMPWTQFYEVQWTESVQLNVLFLVSIRVVRSGRLADFKVGWSGSVRRIGDIFPPGRKKRIGTQN